MRIIKAIWKDEDAMGESKTKIKFEEKLFKLPDYARNKGGILDDQDLMA